MITSSASRIVETACWVLGVALVTGYLSARAYGEIERRQGISAFTESRLLAASDVDGEPDDQRQGLELTIPTDAPDRGCRLNFGLRCLSPHGHRAAVEPMRCAGTAGAQQQLGAGSDRTSSSAQTASRAEVNWAQDLLALYPRIADACQEVVLVDDEKWARFAADYVRSDSRSNMVTLNFKNRQGRPMGDLILQPAAEQRAFINGRSVRMSELSRGQELNIYVPEGMFAAALVPGAPPEQLAQIVSEPITPAQADPAPTPLLAQANQATAQRLLGTAGPLPLFALAGLMSLLGGLGLTIRRRFFARRG